MVMTYTGCPRRPINPIFVQYWDEEGICPIFSFEMSYKTVSREGSHNKNSVYDVL